MTLFLYFMLTDNHFGWDCIAVIIWIFHLAYHSDNS